MELKLENNCLANEVYDSHKRAKNWVAIVRRDVSKPGGLDRDFCKHTSGLYFKLPRELQAGDQIEMAGDYYTCAGRKSPNRRYFRIDRLAAGLASVTPLEKSDVL